jgi:hypothetical protein
MTLNADTTEWDGKAYDWGVRELGTSLPMPRPSDVRTSHGLSKDRLILSRAQGHSRRDTIKSETRRRTCDSFW